MFSLFKKLCLGAALPLLSGAALANHHEPIARYMVEAIPFALKEGKTLDDMMKLRGDFAKLAAAENFAYNAYVLTPHFMSRSSLPVDGKFDAVWLGFSPDPSALAAGLASYVEKGQRLERAFDAVREVNQRWLMRGELLHRGAEPDGEGPGYAFFQTCHLKDGVSLANYREAEVAWSAAMEKLGTTASAHIWYAGQGVPDALQGAMIKVRIFPSIQSWGDSYTKFQENNMGQSPEWRAMAAKAECGPIRSYLGQPFYEAEEEG